MVNSCKLTNLIIVANNVGVLIVLDKDAKSIEQIAKK